jgi:hypothetical protein
MDRIGTIPDNNGDKSTRRLCVFSTVSVGSGHGNDNCDGGEQIRASRRDERAIAIDLRRTGRTVAIAHATGVEKRVAVDNAGAIGAGRIVAETNAAIIEFDAWHLIWFDWFYGLTKEKCVKNVTENRATRKKNLITFDQRTKILSRNKAKTNKKKKKKKKRRNHSLWTCGNDEQQSANGVFHADEKENRQVGLGEAIGRIHST